MMKKNKITVIGIGNTLYTDEGIGVHILPYLEKELSNRNINSVEIVEGSTDGMRLLADIEDCEYLLIIDAINAGKEPGTIIRLEDDEIPKFFGIKMSVHQVGFQEVLFASRIREQLPKEMVMIGAQPYSLELNIGLSKEMENNIPKMVDDIINQINIWSDK
jgi:hydrogenase maturation protease